MKNKVNSSIGHRSVSKTNKMFDYTYFVLHSIISLLLFFGFSEIMDLFTLQTDTITDIFTKEHLNFVLIIMAVSLISSIGGRIISYVMLWVLYNVGTGKKHKKVVKSFPAVNRGINKMDFAYLVSTFVSSLLYSVGAIFILKQVLFSDRDSFIFLVLSYLILKTVTEMIVYYKLR